MSVLKLKNTSRDATRFEVAPYFKNEICCGGEDMRVSTKKFGNHFRIATVCQSCERRRLWIFNLKGELIKVTN